MRPPRSSATRRSDRPRARRRRDRRVGLLVGSLADFWTQELVRAVQRELYGAARSTLVADADGEPGARARARAEARRPARRRAVVVPIGPSGGGWASIARQLPTVTIGDALPGRRRPARWCSTTSSASSRRSSTSASSATTASRCSRGRSRPRPTARPSAPSSPRRPRSGSTCNLVACAYSLNGSRPLAVELLESDDRPDRGAAACPTRSPTASTRRAPSSACRSPATSRSPASATTRSRGCSRRR